MRPKVEEVLNIAEMRERARRRLPRPVFDAIDGGAGDEMTVQGNRDAYRKYWIRANDLQDVAHRDLSTSVLGERISVPVMLGPCGFSRMCSADAELAIARGAAATETQYVVTGASAFPLTDIRKAATGATSWYQFYAPATREETERELRRIREAGYRVLCITVDTALNPVRDRDYYNRLTLPLKLSPSLIRHGISRPAWAKEFLLGRVGQMTAGGVVIQLRDFARMIARVRPITLDEIAWMKTVFEGPVVVKGVMRGTTIEPLLDAGIDGVVVSNHGGRNLDGARPTLDILPEVVEAAGGRMEVFMDGGVRRGSDVLKALALGARAVLIGRPYMFGLGAYGEAGVRRVVEILRLELEWAMALAGVPTISDIDASTVVLDTAHAHPEPTRAAVRAL